MRWQSLIEVRRLRPQTRTILLTCIVGLGGGLAAVAFQVSLSKIYQNTYLRLAGESRVVFLLGTFAVITVTSLISGILLNSFSKEAAGSGIPQVKLAYWKEFGLIPWRAVWVKFIGGALSVGGGSSLGREGPSVHIAGGLASNLAGWLGEPKQNRRRAAAAGAAAGLAAAFNTPLAAATFVLEEIVEDLNSRSLGSVILAAVIGALVVHGLVGRQPAFSLENIDAPSWRSYLLTPIVAGVAGLAGIAFQRGTLRLRQAQRQLHWCPGWLRPVLGAIPTWALGVTVFLLWHRLGVFGLGYEDLSDALNARLPWNIAGVLLFTKLAATILCYGFGGAGGIFSPTLCFGGMAGVFVSGMFGHVLNLGKADHMTLAVVGMSACLGAAVRAPVTGILIVFEMTHEFPIVPALMLGGLISQTIARRLTSCNFYDAILRQDGHELEHVIPPRDLQGWQQLPLSAVANFRPVCVTDVSEKEVRALLGRFPFQRFPVLEDGHLTGILTRKEAEIGLREHTRPKLERAVTCLPNSTIGDLQRQLLESTTLFAVIVDEPNGRVLAIVSLHDLLRAQLAFADKSG